MTTLRNTPHAHEWEMISAFSLSLPKERSGQAGCLLEPVVRALAQFGMDEALLCAISLEVEQAGEALRGCCPDDRLECVNVRVQASVASLRGQRDQLPWRFFVIKQMASSESDNLDFDNPRCFIDLHVYQD